jgi:hypothetical protein
MVLLLNAYFHLEEEYYTSSIYPWGTCSWFQCMIFIAIVALVVCCPACPIVVHQFETHNHLRDRPCTYYHGLVPSTGLLWCKRSFNMYICPFLCCDGLPSSLPWISFQCTWVSNLMTCNTYYVPFYVVMGFQVPCHGSLLNVLVCH